MAKMPPFSEFGTYLKSPEYAAALRKLLGEPASPPRTIWPDADKDTVQSLRERADMCIRDAARLMLTANELAARSATEEPQT